MNPIATRPALAAFLLVATGLLVFATAPRAHAQVQQEYVRAGESTSFRLTIVNFGPGSQSFTITAAENAEPGWLTQYEQFLGGTTFVDITTAVLSTGFNTGTLNVGEPVVLRITLTADTAPVASEKTATVTATASGGAPPQVGQLSAIVMGEIIVNDDRDLEDMDPAPEIVDVDPGEPGHQITLRAALNYTNNRPGLDYVGFDVPPSGSNVTIKPGPALPVITDLTIIDGLSQNPAATVPPIEISGIDQAFGSITDGLVTLAPNCTFRGLAINGFHESPNRSYTEFLGVPNQSAIVLKSDGNLVEFCHLGTNRSGTAGIANEGYGVIIDGTSGNTVQDCLISGNWIGGVLIRGTGASNNLVIYNRIGTDVTGSSTNTPGRFLITYNGHEVQRVEVSSGSLPEGLGNGNLKQAQAANFGLVAPTYSATALPGGVAILHAPGNVVGGNVIAGNHTRAVGIVGSAATGNRIEGNVIGLPSPGASKLMLNFGGIWVGAPQNFIGRAGAGNLIGDSVILKGDSNTTVQANTVFHGGLSIGGTAQQLNSAITVAGSANALIGGSLPGEGNVFIHAGEAIVINPRAVNPVVDTLNPVIQGNFIGVEADGTTPAPNHVGILIKGGTNALVGGTNPGEGNVIARNDTGIHVWPTAVGHRIVGNSIHSNQVMPIDLSNVFDSLGDGPDDQDISDADVGGNDKTNWPVITSLVSDGATTQVAGFLHFRVNGPFRFDFYENPTRRFDGRPYGGENRVASLTVTGTALDLRQVSFDELLPVALAPGITFITVTSTDPNNSTSEFSPPTIVQGATHSEGDGLSDEVENLVANRTANGFGDGNGDGTLDSQQAHVASLPSTAGEFLTLESDALAALAKVSAPSATTIPGWPAEFSLGLVTFNLSAFTGGATTVTILLPPGSPAFTSFYNYGPTPADGTDHWYQFPFDGTTGAVILSDRIVLHFADGQRGDHDLALDGLLTTLGGPTIEFLKPHLDITGLPNGDIFLFWPPDPPGWTLQFTDDFTAGTWSDPTEGSGLDAIGFFHRESIGTGPNPRRFFRLHRPWP